MAGPLTAPQVLALTPRGTTLDEAAAREREYADAMSRAAGTVPEGDNYRLEEITVKGTSWLPWLLIALAIGLAFYGDVIRRRL